MYCFESFILQTKHIFMYLVTRHGVWDGNWIYLNITNRNYKLLYRCR
jgi:hypothetical protein